MSYFGPSPDRKKDSIQPQTYQGYPVYRILRRKKILLLSLRKKRRIAVMTKFNIIEKKRRAQIAEKKRNIYGDPLTKKLKVRAQALPLATQSPWRIKVCSHHGNTATKHFSPWRIKLKSQWEYVGLPKGGGSKRRRATIYLKDGEVDLITGKMWDLSKLGISRHDLPDMGWITERGGIYFKHARDYHWHQMGNEKNFMQEQFEHFNLLLAMPDPSTSDDNVGREIITADIKDSELLDDRGWSFDGASKDTIKAATTKFHIKKGSKLTI